MRDSRVRTDGRRDIEAAVRRRVERARAAGAAAWAEYLHMSGLVPDEPVRWVREHRITMAARAKADFWKGARRMLALQKALLLSMAARFERGAR